jgi:hypothetical protein
LTQTICPMHSFILTLVFQIRYVKSGSRSC